MKDSQFVHGDLRGANIMIRNDDMSSDSPTPIVIDFDWAGKETEAKYPSSINKNVFWPADVSAKGLIECEHDNKMVNHCKCLYISTCNLNVLPVITILVLCALL